jgi:polyphosphate kinase
LGTGNYHPKTARLYEDFGLLTTDAVVGEDVSRLFNVLSGYSMNNTYDRLLVAPRSIRTGLIERIDREVANHRKGLASGIRFKCNSIVDERIIDALYRAAQQGVPVDIWVRGICAARPGIPGTEGRFRVRSILGKFLEHSRAYEFHNNGATEVWIGSADLMHRNLDRRVETLVLLDAPEHVQHIDRLFQLALSEGTSAWDLNPDGSWTRSSRDSDGEPLVDLQDELIARMAGKNGKRGSGA